MARSASEEGAIFPRGAAWVDEDRAYNFSLYAQHAESVVVLLFSEDDLVHPLLEYHLDPRVNKTWMVWHCRLAGPEAEARPLLRLPHRRTARFRAGELARLRPAKGVARPLREGAFLPAGL